MPAAEKQKESPSPRSKHKNKRAVSAAGIPLKKRVREGATLAKSPALMKPRIKNQNKENGNRKKKNREPSASILLYMYRRSVAYDFQEKQPCVHGGDVGGGTE
ncbi:hypothetical protein [Ruminococcus sp. YE71]|uniref:hypothetical protein n=1 Tax=Ruminococcus sp. YE71 TaxID=244362 RepID=UPI00093117F6|nr:hypothetical protein [Ruminococcus sp. YE71]